MIYFCAILHCQICFTFEKTHSFFLCWCFDPHDGAYNVPKITLIFAYKTEPVPWRECGCHSKFSTLACIYLAQKLVLHPWHAWLLCLNSYYYCCSEVVSSHNAVPTAADTADVWLVCNRRTTSWKWWRTLFPVHGVEPYHVLYSKSEFFLYWHWRRKTWQGELFKVRYSPEPKLSAVQSHKF